MSISGKTKVYGLLGDPVAHSLSPLMHNHAFEKTNIDAVYVPFRVSPSSLSEAVAGLRGLNIAGVNVTIPHKEAILPFLDKVDPEARLIGAVNTVVNAGGKLVGYNTDASGFLRSACQDLNFMPAGKSVLLLGSGGACRAATVALAAAGIDSLVIANRSLARAEKLISDLKAHFPQVNFEVFGYSDPQYPTAVARADLIVNTTSVGLKGDKLNFLPLENIKGSALIYDMIYFATVTPLLRAAQAAGVSAADGLGMLAAQGEDAFFLWTGVRLPAGYMKALLMQQR